MLRRSLASVALESIDERRSSMVCMRGFRIAESGRALEAFPRIFMELILRKYFDSSIASALRSLLSPCTIATNSFANWRQEHSSCQDHVAAIKMHLVLSKTIRQSGCKQCSGKCSHALPPAPHTLHSVLPAMCDVLKRQIFRPLIRQQAPHTTR